MLMTKPMRYKTPCPSINQAFAVCASCCRAQAKITFLVALIRIPTPLRFQMLLFSRAGTKVGATSLSSVFTGNSGKPNKLTYPLIGKTQKEILRSMVSLYFQTVVVSLMTALGLSAHLQTLVLYVLSANTSSMHSLFPLGMTFFHSISSGSFRSLSLASILNVDGGACEFGVARDGIVAS